MRPEQYLHAHRDRLPTRLAVALTGTALLLVGAAACTTGSNGAQPTSSPPVHGSPGTTAPTDGTGPATGSGQSTLPSQASSGPPSSEAPSTGATTAHAKKSVPVQITIFDWNAKTDQAEVDAFVPGAVIAGGTCTLTLTNGAISRTATHPAITTPTSTSCGLMAVPHAQLSAGTWQAVVRFRAATAAGTSDAVSIKVPA